MTGTRSRTRRRSEPVATGLMVAITGWTGTIDGEVVTLCRGREVDATDPVVAEHPELFIAHGHPLPPDPAFDYELPPARKPADVTVNQPLSRLLMRVTRVLDVQVIGGARVELEPGDLVPSDHELVQRMPDAFEEPR